MAKPNLTLDEFIKCVCLDTDAFLEDLELYFETNKKKFKDQKVDKYTLTPERWAEFYASWNSSAISKTDKVNKVYARVITEMVKNP